MVSEVDRRYHTCVSDVYILTGHLDQEYQSAFVKEIERAGHDQIYWVRREATFALGALAKVVPEELLYASLVSVLSINMKKGGVV